jgi:hypothetical protein
MASAAVKAPTASGRGIASSQTVCGAMLDRARDTTMGKG